MAKAQVTPRWVAQQGRAVHRKMGTGGSVGTIDADGRFTSDPPGPSILQPIRSGTTRDIHEDSHGQNDKIEDTDE